MDSKRHWWQIYNWKISIDISYFVDVLDVIIQNAQQGVKYPGEIS